MPRDETLFRQLYPGASVRGPELREPHEPSTNGNGHHPTAVLDIEPPLVYGATRFPVTALPIAVWEYVLDVARAYEVEPEMAAVPLLACLSAAIGNSRRILLKPGHTEGALLWAVIVARPGAVKTPVMSQVDEPLRDYERYLHEQNKARKNDYEQTLATWEATGRGHRGERPEPPVSRRIVVGDTTMEELAYILGDNPRGVLVKHDEATAWVRGMNQYKRQGGSDRSKWLSIWSGVEFSVDRRAEHGNPLRVWQPFVSVTGGIQPDLLHELRPPASGDDGFFDRVLFAWPEDRLRRWTEATVSPWARDRYRRLVTRLIELEMEPDSRYRGRPIHIPLEECAKALWIERYNAHRDEMAGDDFDPRLHGAYAKFDSYAGRLALLIHCARVAADEIANPECVDSESIDAAWQMVDFFKSGARRAYERFEESEMDQAVAELIAWTRGRGLTEVPLREAMRGRRRGFRTASSGQAVFAAAADRGYGRLDTKPQPGGGKTIVSLVLTERETEPMS